MIGFANSTNITGYINSIKIGLRGGHSRKAQGAVGMINAYDQMQKFYTHVSKLLKDMMG